MWYRNGHCQRDLMTNLLLKHDFLSPHPEYLETANVFLTIKHDIVSIFTEKYFILSYYTNACFMEYSVLKTENDIWSFANSAHWDWARRHTNTSVNWLTGPSDAIWRQRSWSTLAHVMACCLKAPRHYLNQRWLINAKVSRHLSEGIIMRILEDTYK